MSRLRYAVIVRPHPEQDEVVSSRHGSREEASAAATTLARGGTFASVRVIELRHNTALRAPSIPRSAR